MNIGKKLLSLLTVFCLTLSLVPTVALAEGTSTNGVATEVKFVKTSYESNYITLNVSTPYLASGGTSASSEKPNSGKYAYFHDGLLTLNEFTHEKGISTTGDLKIELTGTNKIGTATYNGNNNGSTPDNDIKVTSGNLTIVGPGSLTLQKAVNTSLYVKGNLIIKDGADIKIYGGNFGQAIHTDQSSAAITITGSETKVEATGGYRGSINAGSGGSIDINDGAKLIASSFSGNLKINGVDATEEETNQISSGITASPSTPTYTVSGTVTDEKNSIQGATVQLCTADTVGSSDPTVISYSTTESNGTYTLSNVPANSDNDYAIKVTKEGYTVLTTENFSVSSNVSNKNLTLTAIPPSQYAVTISGQNMTVTSGDASQTINVGSKISDVVFAAAEGYYFPDNYVSSCPNLSGLAVTRDSYTQITVSGKPNASAAITLPSLTEKEEQAAPDFLLAFDCTGIDKNDGRITEMNPTMEYQKESDSASNTWTTVLYGDYGRINNLEPGTYLVRYKETATKKASDSVRITIKVTSEYGVWVCGIPVTSQNKGNVFGNTGTPTATYDSQTGTLTLNNASIDNTATSVLSMGSTKRNTDTAGIMSTEPLVVNVVGNSTIRSDYGNAIKGENLTINSSNASKLTLDSYANMSAIAVNTAKEKLRSLTITGNVAIVATITPKSEGNPPNQADGTAISAYDTVIQDEAKVTAISTGQGLAVFGNGKLTVKDSATLTARSKCRDYAIYTYGDFIYPGHSITASRSFEGNDPETTYDLEKLTTYKYVKVEPITVTGVELNKDSLSIKVGQSETLTATLQPSGAVQDVTWTSSDDKIVTVTNGTVTAVGVGTATITVTTADGSHTASCTVTVTRTSSSGSGSHTTYYPVNTPSKSEGGSVVVSQKSASKGSAVTVTVTPESGYQVSSVQAVDKDGKKLTLTDKGDGKYSFVMPGSKVEVSASFAQVQKPEETSPYRDVSKDSYYYDAVQWASNKGITNGVADSVFAPDWVCTRGQIVTFLWRSVGSPAPKTAKMPFADVVEDAYYAQAVLWAVENGITKGTSETTFSPDQTCTRAHAVAFLYRLVGSPAVTGSSFQDVAADAYYNAAVAWAVQQGITNGTSETTFSPDETCTRAQIVTFLYRMDQAK